MNHRPAVSLVLAFMFLVLAATAPVAAQTDTQSPTATATETATEEADPQGLFELWDNYAALVAFVVLVFVGIGAGSKSLTVGAWGGYMAFLGIAFRGGNQLFRDIGLVTLILVFLGFAFKLVRLEMEGES